MAEATFVFTPSNLISQDMLRSRESSDDAPSRDDLLSIGAVAQRCGLAVSAVRFYADNGIAPSVRSTAGHRRFPRSTIRRISFVLACQRLGYSLEEIRTELDRLPQNRTPTEKDWQRLATHFRSDIDRRIAELEVLRDRLDACIGCGCLSLDRCALYNPGDAASRLGTGARYLLGDSASDIA